jgi:hypothetical protein
MVAPGGSNGATVLAACVRSASFGEVLFFAGSATTGATAAFLFGWQGSVVDADIVAALGA